MQKCGAVPYKVEPHILLISDEEENFADQHTDLISEETIQLAEIFGVRQEKILGGVLHFHISLESFAQERFRFEWNKDGKFERKLEKAIMIYTVKSTLTRINKIKKVAEKEDSQKVKQMLDEYLNELDCQIKSIDEELI